MNFGKSDDWEKVMPVEPASVDCPQSTAPAMKSAHQDAKAQLLLDISSNIEKRTTRPATKSERVEDHHHVQSVYRAACDVKLLQSPALVTKSRLRTTKALPQKVSTNSENAHCTTTTGQSRRASTLAHQILRACAVEMLRTSSINERAVTSSEVAGHAHEHLQLTPTVGPHFQGKKTSQPSGGSGKSAAVTRIDRTRCRNPRTTRLRCVLGTRGLGWPIVLQKNLGDRAVPREGILP